MGKATFSNFVYWAFLSAITGSGIFGVTKFSNLVESVEKLNKNVAVILERTNWYEKEFKKIEKDFNKIEKRLLKLESKHY